jgi:hypothetical protein
MKEWMILAAILIPVLAAGIAVGIYFLVKALRAKAKAKAPATIARIPPAPKPPAPKPPAPKPMPPAPKPPAPKPTSPAPKPRSVLPAVPFVPDAPAKFVPSSVVPAQPPAPARTNCPKGRVPDPDNPSKLCKPSCRGADLGYAFWGPSGSCCNTTTNTDCISWDQISKINDDKVAAEQERKRRIAEAAAAAEAERQRQAEAERQKRAEAERQRLEAERQRQAEAERQRQEAERQKRAEAERQRQAEAERQKRAEADRQKRAEADRQRQSVSSNIDIAGFVNDVNKKRASVGSGPLEWSEEPARAAVAWAKISPGWPNVHGKDPAYPGYAQCWYADGSLNGNAMAVLMKGVELMWSEGNLARASGVATPAQCDKAPDWEKVGHWCILGDPTAKKIGAGVAVSVNNQRDQDNRTILTSVIHVA